MGDHGTIPQKDLNQERDWSHDVQKATFLSYGKMNRDWDWGYVMPYFTPEPITVGDALYFYYAGYDAKHWWNWTGDPPEQDPNAPPPKQWSWTGNTQKRWLCIDRGRFQRRNDDDSSVYIFG